MPYIEEMVSIGKAENGYVLTVRVPYNDDLEDYDRPMHVGSREKVILCTDTKELGEKLEKLLPSLKDKMDSAEEFNTAFKESVATDSY